MICFGNAGSWILRCAQDDSTMHFKVLITPIRTVHNG